ncbi:MAG: SMC-Scp complex subunit ScpB, partial [Ignavibacteriaceae bacterium]|nr:SMC-Scp complex subunit ScpB [Ignavibacteriaceae bacterium]
MDNIYNSIIEALIFSSDEPLNGDDIIKAIRGIDGDDVEITLPDIENCVNSL